MSKKITSRQRHKRRHRRIRAVIKGTAERPRLSVSRSLKGIYAQLIDDTAGKTIIGLGQKDLPKGKGNKTDWSRELGKLVAKKARAKKISAVVFDRGGCAYHGRVKALAEGAREGGLKF